jgi:hypothetical protein
MRSLDEGVQQPGVVVECVLKCDNLRVDVNAKGA